MTATRRSSGITPSYVPPPPPSQAAQGPPPFLNKTYDLVEEAATDPIISWAPGGQSFIVWKPAEFARDLLPLHFKHNNFSSFVRQLNTYGFRKVDPDRWEFANDGFIRGRKELLKDIHRRKAVPQAAGAGSQLSNVGGPLIEVGSFGGLADEVEGLKRDKNVLMLELVRLRQQQQNSEAEIRKLHARLEKTDQRQHQMMTFLTKAMHDPAFLQQILASRAPAQRITTGGRKKRRAQRAQDSGSDGESPIEDPNMQLVQYQPTQNDFSKPFLNMLQREGNPYVDEAAVPGQEDADFDVGTAFGGLNIRPTPRSDVTITEDPAQQGPPLLFPGMPTIPPSPLQSPLSAAEHQGGGATPLIIGSRPIDPAGSPPSGQHDMVPVPAAPLEAAHFPSDAHVPGPLRSAMDSLDFLPDMMQMQSGDLHDDMGEEFWQALINHPQDASGPADGSMYDYNPHSYHPAAGPSDGQILNG